MAFLCQLVGGLEPYSRIVAIAPIERSGKILLLDRPECDSSITEGSDVRFHRANLTTMSDAKSTSASFRRKCNGSEMISRDAAAALGHVLAPCAYIRYSVLSR